MTVLQDITAYIANTTTTLSPINLPLAPVTPLSQLLHHVTTTHVHPVYYPFLRFGAIHAARVTLVWAALTRGRKRTVPFFQDLFGYLVMCWGGGTVTSLLLSQPPSWLIDPTPWLVYPPIYLALVSTGLARFIVSTAPTLVNLFGAYIDGITRGTTISALPSTLSASSPAIAESLLATALISGITVSSGGWIVQAFGMHEDEWKVGKPTVLNGGVLDTLDLWSGALTGLLYATLTGSFAELDGARAVLALAIPDDLRAKRLGKGIVDTNTARAISVLVLGSLLAARVVTQAILGLRDRKPVTRVQTQEEIIEELTGEKVEVVKTPLDVQIGGTKVTPRKKRGKSAGLGS
ncbi:hypothetical protein DB88DRAFT_67105 [Papiliotrema laurentii]|uniref:Uncharacterized protein n=1 Tax=Papiliotrema laurentii TaxID=5418 RepID=A0AAD9CYM4_PAPLA|nr:hypothetical protein DB88DRAFT_67105 [Papiliotrema laurentii]